jgi:hypothetical protein
MLWSFPDKRFILKLNASYGGYVATHNMFVASQYDKPHFRDASRRQLGRFLTEIHAARAGAGY